MLVLRYYARFTSSGKAASAYDCGNHQAIREVAAAMFEAGVVGLPSIAESEDQATQTCVPAKAGDGFYYQIALEFRVGSRLTPVFWTWA